MTELIAGDRLDQYKLEELLARSGMASIFKGIDTHSGKPVALKVPHLRFESDVVFFERFRREEDIGQRLDHPNVIKVFAPVKKSRMYLAMELVEGTSLRALLDTEKRFSPDRAVEIARQIAEALVYLHANGVVHRDLKPENVLVDKAGKVKVLDFGIALDGAARRLTWAGLSSTIGTPDYMAPEQASGRRGDVRTDVYSLGVILFEMLTGELPFVGANANTILRAKSVEDPRSPRDVVSDIDPKIEEIVLHAIERVPRDRYARAADMIDDLKDPSRVVLRDRSNRPARNPALTAIARRAVFPLTMVAILVGLAMLIWLTGRRDTHRPHGGESRSAPAQNPTVEHSP